MKIRIDNLKPGDRFKAVDGNTYTFVRQDGGNRGAYHAEREDGFSTVFAGCAEVETVPNGCAATPGPDYPKAAGQCRLHAGHVLRGSSWHLDSRGQRFETTAEIEERRAFVGACIQDALLKAGR